MFFYSHVLPVSGAIPEPGQDMSGASWQRQMRFGEIALFNFDVNSGQLLGPKGQVPQMPVQEICMVFGSRYAARASARSQIVANPQKLIVLYDHRGRWLSTHTTKGETRRNPGLGLAWILAQFPLLALYGTVALVALSATSASYFGTEPIRFREMSSQELASLFTGGLIFGAVGRLLFEFLRMRLLIWHGRPALAPLGSPEREKLYKRLAKRDSSGRLVPLEISPVPGVVQWPVPEKHAEWSAILQSRGFQRIGEFSSPETKGGDDFWFHPDEDLTAVIATLPSQGMWLSVFTRYEDGRTFSAVNKLPTGIALPPQKKVTYLGLEAAAEAVIEHALRNRPEGNRRRPTAENLLQDYRAGWRENVGMASRPASHTGRDQARRRWPPTTQGDRSRTRATCKMKGGASGIFHRRTARSCDI